MQAHGADLTGIALVVSVAVISGLVLTVLRQPPLVGYVLAGVVLGPAGFGVEGRAGKTLLQPLKICPSLFLLDPNFMPSAR